MSSSGAVSSKSARSVRKLYGALLRMGRKWPVTESRKDRSLWEAIPRVAKQRFTQLRSLTTQDQVKTYGDAGVKELEALKRLHASTHLKEYPLKHNYAASFMTQVTKEMDDDLVILSSQYQAKEQGKTFGGDMQFLNKLFYDKADAAQNKKANATATNSEPAKPL